MSVAEIREDLVKRINIIDERFLKAVHLMVSSYQEEEDPIIGYDIDGSPRTASELTNILDEQVEAGLRGEYTTLENLRKESDQWLIPTK